MCVSRDFFGPWMALAYSAAANLAWIMSVFLFYGSLNLDVFSPSPFWQTGPWGSHQGTGQCSLWAASRISPANASLREIKRKAEGLYRIESFPLMLVRKPFLLYGAIPLQQKRDVSKVNWGLEVKAPWKTVQRTMSHCSRGCLGYRTIRNKRIACLAEVVCLKMRKAEAANSREPLLV